MRLGFCVVSRYTIVYRIVVSSCLYSQFTALLFRCFVFLLIGSRELENLISASSVQSDEFLFYFLLINDLVIPYKG